MPYVTSICLPCGLTILWTMDQPLFCPGCGQKLEPHLGEPILVVPVLTSTYNERVWRERSSRQSSVSPNKTAVG